MGKSKRTTRRRRDHWHCCEVCGDRALLWKDRCTHDADHDYGFCDECRLVMATLNDGTRPGQANLEGFLERMALWRRFGKPQLHWRRMGS